MALDLLSSASNLVKRTLANAFARTVTIRRGQLTASVSATKGQTTVDAFDAEGLPIRLQAQDWLIAREDYDFGFGPTEPERGDQVEEMIGGRREIYDALPLEGTNELWRWSDPDHSLIRLHTNRVDFSS